MGKKRKGPTDTEVEERIRAHIRAFMAARDITAADCARRFHMHPSHLGRILKGERGGISPGFILRVCEAMLVRPDVLLLERPDPRFFEKGSETPPRK